MSQRFRIPSRGARPRTSRAWLALLLAVVCGCDADPPRSDGGAWDWDAGCPPDTVCETSWCTSDGDPSNDVGTLVLPIDTLELPVSSDPTVMAGLDIDGQTTQADSDSAGCFVRDTVESPTSTRRTVDNGVAFAAPSLLPLGLDLSRAFAASVSRRVE